MVSRIKDRWRSDYWYIVLLLIAALLRLWDIQARSLWFDEAVEYISSNTAVGNLNENVLKSFQPPLYTYLLHLWLIVGESELWLRLLSIVLSLLTVAGAMTWGGQLWGRRGGMLAGGIVALLPVDIRYAQEVAEYALLGCTLMWSFVYLDRAMHAARWRWWLGWGVCSLLAIYSHYGAGIMLGSTGLAALLINAWGRRWRAVGQQSVVGVGVAVMTLPLYWFFLRYQLATTTSRTAVAPWTSLPAELRGFVRSIGETAAFQLTGWPFTATPLWISWAILGLVVALGLWMISHAGAFPRYIVIWLGTGYLCYFVAVRSGMYGYGSFGFRYTIILIPLFAITVAGVLHFLLAAKRLILAIGLSLSLALPMIYSLPNRTLSTATRGDTPWPETQDMREAVGAWRAAQEPGQLTYVYYGAIPAFRYYASHLEPSPDQAPLICADQASTHPCPDIWYGRWFRSLPPSEKIASIQTTLNGWPPELWIIFAHYSNNEDQQILQALAGQYSVEKQFRYTNAAAYLLKLR